MVGGSYVGLYGALQDLTYDASNNVYRLGQIDGTVYEWQRLI
jgi:hypothetical protein